SSSISAGRSGATTTGAGVGTADDSSGEGDGLEVASAVVPGSVGAGSEVVHPASSSATSAAAPRLVARDIKGSFTRGVDGDIHDTVAKPQVPCAPLWTTSRPLERALLPRPLSYYLGGVRDRRPSNPARGFRREGPPRTGRRPRRAGRSSRRRRPGCSRGWRSAACPCPLRDRSPP